jgi:hypothetical protein
VIQRRLIWLLILLAAAVPYLPTLDDYFVQDDFGVVSLLAAKPWSYFPRWFASTWMDDIWGYTPDEIRPFTAVTYQFAALWNAGSPVSNHAINILFHAANALLVFGVAEVAAGLSLGPAAFAAIVFAVLPMQTESVAWITGRVDSMPACFYLASFLLYAHWRRTAHQSLYIWALVAYFVALFTKQNTVTLPAALVLYDVWIARRPLSASWEWLRPYVPFVLLTIAYLALRYILFGEVAREGTVNAERVGLFLQDLSIHLRRMAFGEHGLQISGISAVIRVAVGAAVLGAIAALAGERSRAPFIRAGVYFLIVWIGLAAAPTLVAGYASPRHMYLASAGWALALAAGLEILWWARPHRLMRGIGLVLAGAVVAAYIVQLRHEVRLWSVRADVSRRVVIDVEREAMAAPPGTLMIVDAPRRSWNFALPHALRPPFTRADLTRRVSVISHSAIHCCPANVWEPYTRETVRAWAATASRRSVVALRWDPDTGNLFRLDDRTDPFLRTAVLLMLDTRDVAQLDRLIVDISNKLVLSRSR